MHCAGKIAISERERKETFAVKENVLRYAESGAHMRAVSMPVLCMFCSTDAVFCGSGNGDIRDNMLRMSEPKGFYPELMKGCYAQSKAMAGQYVLDECKNGLDACVVCPCAVLGANDYKPSLAGRLVRDYLRGAPLAVIDGGYDFISATDAARGIILAAQKGKKRGMLHSSGRQNHGGTGILRACAAQRKEAAFAAYSRMACMRGGRYKRGVMRSFGQDAEVYALCGGMS